MDKQHQKEAEAGGGDALGLGAGYAPEGNAGESRNP